MNVSNSEINGDTVWLWSGADCVSDSINTGSTLHWAAKESIRCIDAGSEFGTYFFSNDEHDTSENCIKSSIILYPDANGKYTYFSSSGVAAELEDKTVIDKNLFISMLGFDEEIWNLDNIDITAGKYPTIR